MAVGLVTCHWSATCHCSAQVDVYDVEFVLGGLHARINLLILLPDLPEAEFAALAMNLQKELTEERQDITVKLQTEQEAHAEEL